MWATDFDTSTLLEVRADQQANPPVFTPGDPLPCVKGKGRAFDPSTGILTVSLDMSKFSDFQSNYEAAKQAIAHRPVSAPGIHLPIPVAATPAATFVSHRVSERLRQLGGQGHQLSREGATALLSLCRAISWQARPQCLRRM